MGGNYAAKKRYENGGESRKSEKLKTFFVGYSNFINEFY